MDDKDANTESAAKLDREQARLSRMEKKLAMLFRISFVQILMLGTLLVSALLPRLILYLQLIAFVLVTGVAAYLFRNQIPGWFARMTESVYSLISDPEQDRSHK